MSRVTSLALVAAATLSLSVLPASAEIIHLTAHLSGAKEVPPNDSKGSGTLTATFNTTTSKLSWSVAYSGLTGPAFAAHFHGPAKAGKNAPVLVPMMHVAKSPIVGSAQLSKAEARDLLDGEMYVNIHTKAHAPGEIRGQVMRK
jgi:CHRD domain